MKRHLLLFLMFIVFSSCNFGRIPNKDLSESNISYVELSYPMRKNKNIVIRLDSIQINLFSKILAQRKEELVEPDNCYDLYIKLKNSSVRYRTDGVNFQGYDDSTDLPFSFSTKQNILKVVFKLENIEHCE